MLIHAGREEEGDAGVWTRACVCSPLWSFTPPPPPSNPSTPSSPPFTGLVQRVLLLRQPASVLRLRLPVERRGLGQGVRAVGVRAERRAGGAAAAHHGGAG